MKELFRDIPGFEGKYSVSNLGNVMSLNYLNQKKAKNVVNSKPILQYSKTGDFIQRFECISDAAREIGCNPCMIINNASGRTKSAHGFIWKYTG